MMLNYVEEAKGAAGPQGPVKNEGGRPVAKATMNRRSEISRVGKATPASNRVTVRDPGGKSAIRFSERKSIEELAAEQGLKPTMLEDILGKGADLWESDQDFARFVEDIYARRREDRELAKP
jgi:hypothetical protein